MYYFGFDARPSSPSIRDVSLSRCSRLFYHVPRAPHQGGSRARSPHHAAARYVSITAYVTGEAAARASALPKTQPASAVLISIRRPKTPATRNKGENVEREKAVRAATKAIVFPFSDAAANIRVHGTYTALLRAKWRGRSRRESQRLSLAYRIILARDKIEIRPVRFISAGAKLVLSSLETYRCKRVTLIGIRDEFVGLPPPHSHKTPAGQIL